MLYVYCLMSYMSYAIVHFVICVMCDMWYDDDAADDDCYDDDADYDEDEEDDEDDEEKYN